MSNKLLWIGLVNIVPKEGNAELFDAKGAFTNTIMYAYSESDFIDSVKSEFDSKKYYVIDIEDVELFSNRASKYQLREELLDLAKFVEQTGKAGIDKFHLYEVDESLN